MASGAQMGLPLQDLTCRIPFASEGPHHGNRFGILRDLGLVNNLPMLEFRVLIQLTRHGINELVTVWLLQCHVEGHCIWIAICKVGLWSMQKPEGWQMGGSQRRTGCQFVQSVCSDRLHTQIRQGDGPDGQFECNPWGR